MNILFNILGWYSLVLVILAVGLMIADEEDNNGKKRVVGLSLFTPIVIYIAFTLFR